ncbi:MAG: hypothetical protein KJ747_00095 [Actinobacteria bacterium]|nr:hypothetical protein [Actinomycetota bacterium]MCG2807148.1 hypothetical protein [Coriobacteriia bacterium]
MTAIITQYRVLSALILDRDRSDDVFLRAVNLQAGLSYFVSGVSKLFGSSWVQGDALEEILNTESYGGGPAARLLRYRPKVARLLTWFTPLWEAAFPLIYLVPPRTARLGLSAVKLFHLSVAAVMELPRFVWGFSGSHGAVRYVVERRASAQAPTTGLERVALASAAGVAVVSAIHAASQRQLDSERRRGLKGTKLLEVADGVIEYHHLTPSAPGVNAIAAPIVVLEAGLGTALETWSWVGGAISPICHVVSYHRRGYGLTTSSLSGGEAVAALVSSIDSRGPLIVASHSIGLLNVATYANSIIAGKQIAAVVLVDGTDPDLLDQDRSDRRRIGMFLQSQLGTVFMAITGLYNFVPNAVSRQNAFAPDDQSGVVQFAFSPRNIYRAVREYLDVRTAHALDSLAAVKRKVVVASSENASQQAELAQKLGAEYRLVDGSSHRSVLGNRQHAATLSQIVVEVAANAL